MAMKKKKMITVIIIVIAFSFLGTFSFLQQMSSHGMLDCFQKRIVSI